MKKRYFIEKVKIKDAIRKNRVFMLLYYGIGFIIILSHLLFNFHEMLLQLKIIFIISLFIIPFAYHYFDKKYFRVLNRQFEINDEELLIYEFENVKERIKLKSINRISKEPKSYQIEVREYKITILEEIKDVRELIDIIASKNNNTIR